MQIDPTLVMPDTSEVIDEGAIEPWSRSAASGTWYLRSLEGLADDDGLLARNARSANSPRKSSQRAALRHRRHVHQLRFTNQYGRTQHYDTKYEGVVNNLERRFKETESDYVRTEIEKYMAPIPCPACRGKRLRPEALGVLIDRRASSPT